VGSAPRSVVSTLASLTAIADAAEYLSKPDALQLVR
jgi:hypothetical protein